MSVHHYSLDDPFNLRRLLSEANVLVRAQVISATGPIEPFFAGEDYRYRVKVEETWGAKLNADELEVKHTHYRVHQRDEKWVAPLYLSSGIETKLATGEQYLLFMQISPENSNRLVRAETIGERVKVLGAWKRKLLFLGTVEAIETAPIKGSTLNWIVRMRVKNIRIGDFKGKTFSFRVHTPAKSGLEKGNDYEVSALWEGDGYYIDPHQWRRD